MLFLFEFLCSECEDKQILSVAAHLRRSSSLEERECCSADHLKRRMLHCEQLCFKAGSHQGRFSQTLKESILSFYSGLLPSQSSLHTSPQSLSSVRTQVKQKRTHTQKTVTYSQLQLNTTYISYCHF